MLSHMVNCWQVLTLLVTDTAQYYLSPVSGSGRIGNWEGPGMRIDKAIQNSNSFPCLTRPSLPPAQFALASLGTLTPPQLTLASLDPPYLLPNLPLV